MSAPIRVDATQLEAVARRILSADGCGPEEADVSARHLVGANLSGHDSHGVIRLERYHAWVSSGLLRPGHAPATIADTGTFLHLDGQRGMGQWLAELATARGIERARAHGVALVAMRRAGYIGRLGHYAELACAAGLVSIQFANVASSCLVAPYGSARRAISTAPVAVGVPHGEGDDFILDFATSLVAEGKALVAAQGGKALPSDALVGADGRPTGDPHALYGASMTTPVPDPRGGEGALRTMGEHKGSGLALACELVAGALTGNGTNGPNEHPFGNGWLAVFADPGRFGNADGFAAEVADYVEYVRTSPPAHGFDRVRVPGDKEREMRAERTANGIPLSPAVFDGLVGLGAKLGVPIAGDALRFGASGRA